MKFFVIKNVLTCTVSIAELEEVKVVIGYVIHIISDLYYT